ncbi:unnamed protein product [Rotaria sp. Silwood2]|nr:unnamed protein product [Rotaria sp. Silwood2]CAF4311402.1 unnamed protein product [Rotaria sp. Silwood2]CAF4362384.1 unnamed protein product [Rotaria sp. Silwood2]
MYSLLISAFQIYPQNSSLFWCKFLTYTSSILALMSPYFIVLASFDRFCASSINPQLRNWSNPIVARWAILFMIILWALFHVNTLVLCDLRFDDYRGCSIRTIFVYNQIYVILQVILFNVVAPCLMTLFGVLTIFNTKEMRFIPTVKASYRRTEGQLIRMLLVQVVTYVVLNMPLCVIEVFLQLAYKILRINGGIRVNPISMTNRFRPTAIYPNTITLAQK